MGRKRVIVTAARHGCSTLPVSISADSFGRKPISGLKDLSTGAIGPVQADGGLIRWIIAPLAKGESREYEPVPDAVDSSSGVEARDVPDGVEFRIDGELFTKYHHGPDLARPFLYPVIGPAGKRMTRAYPMDKDVPGEKTDHVHHRSIWIAHGDLNGVDGWSEERGHGRTIHREFVETSSGPVFARITTMNGWVGPNDAKVLEEMRSITVYDMPENRRLLDLSVAFRATEGDVTFGDTKEGGIIAIRVATSMDGDRGGVISNAYGGVTEVETWGKRAHWCDYSGPVGGSAAGIAIFDTPGNFRYPTYWHVRDYGLFAANPFALSAYHNDPRRDGSQTLPSGDTLVFRYRVYIHDGDARAANVADEYHGYINPPSMRVE